MPRKTRARAVDDDGPQDEDTTPTGPAEGSLYEVLGVARTASQQEIRKAYHRLALQLHPDKNPDDENANEKFQKLQKVVSILGDPEKRTLYDQTGCIDDEELSKDAVQNLSDFMRSLFRKITEEDIIEFETSYRGSEKERKDLLEYYTKWKGKMNRVYHWVLCSDPKLDSHRFKDIIDSAISAGELKETKAYRQWGAEVMKTQPPANPLKRPSKKRKGAETDITALISQNQINRKKRFDSLFSSIVAEYGDPSDQPEPTEEEFEAARQRMEAQNLKSRTHAKAHEELLRNLEFFQNNPPTTLSKINQLNGIFNNFLGDDFDFTPSLGALDSKMHSVTQQSTTMATNQGQRNMQGHQSSLP